MGLAAGTRLGPYQIESALGAGGMGEVYRAVDTRLGRAVAIKVLSPSAAGNPESAQRFEREARAISSLNHPHICTLYDVGIENGVPFLVMELIAGQTLSERLATGPLPEAEVIQFGLQLAEGLVAAHGMGVLHRDLKPLNLRITSDERLKILDFGLAKLTSPEHDELRSTASHALTGTLPYMAPEQFTGVAVDERTDIWAAGVVLYEMATGKLPFEGKAPLPLANDIVHRTAPSPQSVRAGLSPRLAQIIEKCLEKDPRNRYQSAKELAVDLRRLTMRTGEATLESVVLRPLTIKVPRTWTLVVLALAVGVGGYLITRNRPPAARFDSLAVLPLDDLSGDANQDYFADGMTDALINDLSRIKALKVISHSSVAQYKGSKKPLPVIGRELGVDAVLEGSVQRSADKVRVSLQLVETARDHQLWAESYDRPYRDLLALESEVARRVADEIKVQLTPQEQSRLAAHHVVNPEAHEDYLRGRFHCLHWTPQEMTKGIGYLEQAIGKDPNDALTYAELAECYTDMTQFIYLPPGEAYDKTKRAAEKAVQLDDNLAEAHASLGYFKFFFDWDWQTAEREFKRALELNPGSAAVHLHYSLMLTAAGRFDESIAESKRAVELDPLSAASAVHLGFAYHYARRYDDAISWYKKSLDVDPADPIAHAFLAWAYALKGMNTEALAENNLVKKDALAQHDQMLTSGIAAVEALAGNKRDALVLASTMKSWAAQTYVDPFLVADIYAVAGDKEECLRLLQQGIAQRSVSVIALKTDPFLDNVRSDPRFQALVQRSGVQ